MKQAHEKLTRRAKVEFRTFYENESKKGRDSICHAP